jgi:glyoxylase-like metal-dependent hydrolase (beta-lactamase superfamily II)
VKITSEHEMGLEIMSANSGNYAIYPIPLCVVENFPRAHLHWSLPVNSEERIPDCHYVWYIEGPRERYLVDAGITADRFSSARGLKSTHIQTVDEALNKLGLEISDIDYVIVSHAHHDHITGLRKFPKAKAIIQKAELEQANNPFGYWKPRLPIDYADLLKGAQWEVIEGDTKIDDNLELIFTPGHSAGGQSIAVKTAQGLAVITGFCCMQENFDPPEEFKKKGYPFTLNGSHTNPVDLYESMKRVIGVADVILPCHEYKSLVNVSKIG